MHSRLSLAAVPRFTRSIVAAAALGAVAIVVAAPGPAGAVSASDLCTGHNGSGVSCSLGKGRRTAGGGDKASHAGWPAVTGIRLFVNEGTKGQTLTGTLHNDELLGSHGNDTISGGAGNDVIWGDQLPVGNNTYQHDTLNGEAGNDWIYSSHGKNTISAGAGDDHIFVHFGHGTVNCGPGYDSVKTTLHPKYKFHNCEHLYR